MPYNREWDEGKSWDDRRGGGYARARDGDEGYGDGKRRKYNNGAYEESPWTSYSDGSNVAQGNRGEHSSDHPDSYNNWDRHDQSYDDRGDRRHRDRGGFQGRNESKKHHVASDPSPHVIFLGLDLDFTEADLQNFVQTQGYAVESVTIIRDKDKGLSRGFGFAQFRSTEEAQAFVDPNFPFITVPPPASHGASAAASFKKAIDAGDPAARHIGRRAKIDYSQSANSTGQSRRGPQFENDGTRDIGNTQSAVLLFRRLDHLSGPAAVAQAMKASAGPGKDGAKGMKRVILIRDKLTMASWGYAFVEFVDIQSASAVLANTMSRELHPNGFRISDKPVAASFAHPYSFQAVTDNMYKDESCISSSLNLGGVEGTWVKYWDEGASSAIMEFKVEQSDLQPPPPGEKDKKEKKKSKAFIAGPSAPAEASALPISDKPVTLSFNKVKISTKNTPVQSSATSRAALLFSSHEENEAEEDSANESSSVNAADAKAQQAQRVAPMIASRKVVNNITKWNQVKEELSGVTPAAENPPLSQPTASVAPKEVTPSLEAEAEFEFSAVKAMTCLLCSRQFKSLDVLKRHNKESELHKKNYKDVALRELARGKARAAREKESEQAPMEQADKPVYRDRASERRTLFNQPDVPPPESHSKSLGKRQAEGPPPPPSPPPVSLAPGKDESNIGNKLLKMMGWTEGSGLGVEGEGRVDPIKTAMYASGAGLGASKGKEVGKYQDGYGGYLQMAKDVARERYGN